MIRIQILLSQSGELEPTFMDFQRESLLLVHPSNGGLINNKLANVANVAIWSMTCGINYPQIRKQNMFPEAK